MDRSSAKEGMDGFNHGSFLATSLRLTDVKFVICYELNYIV